MIQISLKIISNGALNSIYSLLEQMIHDFI